MAYDESLANDVRQALSPTKYTEKRMFGGVAFLINGNMCVSVNDRPDHIMMVRIDPADQEALTRKGASVAVMRGRKMPGWIFLTNKAIETQQDFDYWIDLAVAFNKTLKVKGDK
jgi:hypothetical protein